MRGKKRGPHKKRASVLYRLHVGAVSYTHLDVYKRQAQGITTGWPDGTYRPEGSVNRDAMAAFFYRYAGSPEYTAPAQARFTDVPTDKQFYREISWLAEQGVTTRCV